MTLYMNGCDSLFGDELVRGREREKEWKGRISKQCGESD